MIWDLKALFNDTQEAFDFLATNINCAKDFKKKYENKLAKLSLAEFRQALLKYEQLLENEAKVSAYAFLLFAKDTTKGALYASFDLECKKLSNELIFFELEFCQLDEAQTFASKIKGYEYYLQNLLREKKHQLSVKEESLLLKLKSSGSGGFARLFDEKMSSYKFKFDEKKLSEQELLSKLYDEDRSKRKQAAKVFSKKLIKDSHLLGFIYNMIKSEMKVICELRGFKDAQEPMDIYNQISRKSVDALINATQGSFKLVSEYYEGKKKLLGFKKLKDYDRYAPIGKAMPLCLDDAKELVLQSFKEFDPEFEGVAKRAFDEGWVDANILPNKQGGAFSHPSTKAAHPFILLNYTNTRRDAFTLAHELGHAIHQNYSYEQSFLNQNTALTTAETASVFSEMLLFDTLKKKYAKDKQALLGMYAAKIEDIFATLYRQINFTTFERRFHEYQGEVEIKQINEMWLEESKKMFGTSVILGKNYAYWWSYIPHFIHSPFYCYSYAFAQLLVLALFALKKSGKCEDFVNIYKSFLKAGGSRSPKDLVQSFGFDINDAKFWQLGLKEIKNMVHEFTRLCNDR